ncbi:hypothetical protein IGB42_02724 [Andreprevotia sp. IGB-42]|uniref:type IV pilus modification PilV family protein n=1 Tax=Andreprevotia sp. IGB-42 TaxID=2497473 RepID=UPI0013569C71|nr:prepilin-type N-terminal cleavage/methylation domain-containing protein [Andreprevotia sp. IGB-42]KAF0812880.1 hypothetical protein IGB42_02724 [Andreprevotia sp. IGB-42]
MCTDTASRPAQSTPLTSGETRAAAPGFQIYPASTRANAPCLPVRPSCLRQRGFTLFELIFFILIVGIAVAGVTQVYAVAVRASGDPMLRKQALMIAESLLEEIELQPFAASSTPYSGTSRSLFDHVAAYNGYTITGIRDLNGTALPGLSAYTLAVTVQAPAAAIGGVTPANIWVITVTVTDGAGASTRLTGYRFNYA